MKEIAKVTATGTRDGKTENIELRKYDNGEIKAFRNGEESFKVFYDIKMGINIHKIRALQYPWIYNPDENSFEAFMFILYDNFFDKLKDFEYSGDIDIEGSPFDDDESKIY